MRNNETGEFELVLGNKQLLGGFFIIVILFCVFFSMGYILGRNSAPMQRVAAEPVQPAAAVQQAVVTPPQTAPALPPAAEQPKPADAAAQTPAAEAQPEAAQESPAAAEPAAGETYLQVMAVKRPEAEVVVKTLKDKGFPAMIGAGPNDLVRVLVGPYKDVSTLGQAKANLENAGFHPIVRK